jgi:hypothetical protein
MSVGAVRRKPWAQSPVWGIGGDRSEGSPVENTRAARRMHAPDRPEVPCKQALFQARDPPASGIRVYFCAWARGVSLTISTRRFSAANTSALFFGWRLP